MHERARRGRAPRPVATLAAPHGRAKALAEFVRREGLKCGVVAGRTGTVRVTEPEGRKPCTASSLSAGGWISCAAARRMAGELGIPLRSMGRLLDFLEVKIRQCDLECF